MPRSQVRGRFSGRCVMSEMPGVTEANRVQEFKYFIGGEWRAAVRKKLFDLLRPHGRMLHARVAAGVQAESTRAVDAAAKAFHAWSRSTLAVRTRLFFKSGEGPQ